MVISSDPHLDTYRKAETCFISPNKTQGLQGSASVLRPPASSTLAFASAPSHWISLCKYVEPLFFFDSSHPRPWWILARAHFDILPYLQSIFNERIATVIMCGTYSIQIESAYR